MATSKTWPGGATDTSPTAFSIPAAGELNWASLSDFQIALANSAQCTSFQKFAIRKATTTPVTVVAASDCVVTTQLAAPGAVAVTLPAGANKQVFVIADGTGDAATNNITITPNGAETIAGSATLVLSSNRESVMLVYNSGDTDWKIAALCNGPITNFGGVLLPVHGGTGIANNNAATLTWSGNNASTFTTTGTTGVTFPTSGTLATLAGTEALTNKTVNKMAITAPGTSSTLAVADGKTLTASNTLTFTGSDGITVAFGGGLSITAAKILSVSNTLTFTGTDSSSVAFGTGGTVAYIGGTNTWTGQQTLNFTGTGGNPIKGTNTNDAASAGYIGEFISSAIPPASAVAIVNNTAKTVTSISLTAGDWEINAIAMIGGITAGTFFDMGISTTTNAMPSTTTLGDQSVESTGVSTAAAYAVVTVPGFRVSLSGTVVHYLVVNVGFTVSSSPAAFGRISARRLR